MSKEVSLHDNSTAPGLGDTGFPQTLSGTNSVSRVFKIAGGANRARLNLTAISGTGATFNAVYSEVG